MASGRTPDQDLQFLTDELVEIAARALSTGVNDPYTAMTCIDWLTAATADILRRQPPSRYRSGTDGELRVIAPANDLGSQIAQSFGRARPYFARDINVATHALCQLAALASHATAEQQVQALGGEAEMLFALARWHLKGPSLDQLERTMIDVRCGLSERDGHKAPTG